MDLKDKLAKAAANNKAMCERILAGHITESDAVYMPELSGEKCLSDRELYIYHRAWAKAVEAVKSMIEDGDGSEDLMTELIDPAK